MILCFCCERRERSALEDRCDCAGEWCSECILCSKHCRCAHSIFVTPELAYDYGEPKQPQIGCGYPVNHPYDPDPIVRTKFEEDYKEEIWQLLKALDRYEPKNDPFSEPPIISVASD